MAMGLVGSMVAPGDVLVVMVGLLRVGWGGGLYVKVCRLGVAVSGAVLVSHAVGDARRAGLASLLLNALCFRPQLESGDAEADVDTCGSMGH